MKSAAIRELEALALDAMAKKYPNTPTKYFPKISYSDTTSNKLTKAIIDFIRLKGGQAERISVSGRYIDESRVVTDCLGRKRRIGSGCWIKPSMQVGSADISAIIKGKSVKIEVKIGKDRQSIDQKRYQREVEEAGGLYWIANSFESFLLKFNNLK